MNNFFTIRNKKYTNINWYFVEAKKTLLIVYGEIKGTNDIVLIKQYRPPINGYVLSFPMGAFHFNDMETAIKAAKKEAEDESGWKISEIEFCFQFARSPGITDEIALLFKATYLPKNVKRFLHVDEDIESIRLDKLDLHGFVKEQINKGVVIDSSLLFVLTPEFWI